MGKRSFFEDIAFHQMRFLKLNLMISVHVLNVYFFLIHQVRCQVSDQSHIFIVYDIECPPMWHQVSMVDVYRILNAFSSYELFTLQQRHHLHPMTSLALKVFGTQWFLDGSNRTQLEGRRSRAIT